MPWPLVDESHTEGFYLNTPARYTILRPRAEEPRSMMEEAVEEVEKRSEDHAWTTYSGSLGLVSLPHFQSSNVRRENSCEDGLRLRGRCRVGKERAENLPSPKN